MGKNKVLLYTKNNCMSCNMVKKRFDQFGVEYETINIDNLSEEDKSATIKYIKDDLGFSTTPVIVPDVGEPFCGFDIEKIRSLK